MNHDLKDRILEAAGVALRVAAAAGALWLAHELSAEHGCRLAPMTTHALYHRFLAAVLSAGAVGYLGWLVWKSERW